MTFSDYLSEFGLSQSKFAKLAGYTPETVSRWRGSPPEIVMMYCRMRKRYEDFRKELMRFAEGTL